MTGSPERSTSKPLSREAKDRIGASYLMPLLKTNENRMQVSDYARYDNFNDVAGEITSFPPASMPESLAETLGFNSRLKWQIAEQSVMSYLIIGSELGGPKIQDALAIIEISRRSVPEAEPPERFPPLYLRAAGVNKEQNRIVAATYDLTENNRLVKLNISIEEFEAMELSRRNVGITAASIPTSKDNPYQTAGFITNAMVEQVNRRLWRSNGSPHSTVLTLEPHNKLNAAMVDQGYYRCIINGIVTFGLSESTADKNDLSSWEISVPDFLPKT